MRQFNSLFSILFMLLTLGLASGLDRWVSVQRSLVSATFQPRPLLMSILLSALLLVVIWFSLSWWTLARDRGWYVSLVFILVGLFTLLYPILRVMTGWAIFRELGLPVPETIDSRLTYTGAFIATLGAISWLLSGRAINQDE
jgi:hypothetical protein